MRPDTQSRPVTQSDRAKIFGWVRRVKKAVRVGRRVKHDDHLVRGDDDLAEAIVDYSSLASCGWTWPGETRLAEILIEGDRNIRKRIVRLRAAKLLIVIPPSDGWRSNRYVPVLDGRPLFEVASTSEKVRDATAALRRDGSDDTGTPVPPQNTAETGTPVPPEEVPAFQQGWNASSAESSRKNPQEGYSPTPNPAPMAGPTAAQGEEEALDLNFKERYSTARPEPAPTPDSTTETIEQPPPPNGCPRDNKAEIRAEPNTSEQAATPVVEFRFGRLMRDYSHPVGDHGVGHRAYYGHARKAWNKLTPAQKQEAVHAAPQAPGKIWLGHWLCSRRETGKFEVVEQHANMNRVWVRKDTPQWVAWEARYRASGRRPPQTTTRRVNGELETGWWFENEWPAGTEKVERAGGVQ